MESPDAHTESAEHAPRGQLTLQWLRFPCDATDDGRPEDLLGAKGASLCRLAAAGFSVPPFFTIVTAACRWYHTHQKQWPPQLWDEVQTAVARFEADADGGEQENAAPMQFAVRSGAAASMPGLMATRLNVDRDHLQDAIAEVLDSWASAGAKQFRTLHGWSGVEGTSVTIQAMFPAEVSGVAFSRCPDDQESIEIEAVAGAGTPLVGGEVTPVRWRIHRETLERSRRGDNQSLPAALCDFERTGLERLVQDVARIEALFGKPVDVEFGYANGTLSYFQARPIPAADSQLAPERVRETEQHKLQQLCQQGRCWWARHNLAESLPAPTPLTWDVWREFMKGDGGFGALYRRLGYRPSRRIAEHGFLELIGGRIFADVDRIPDMLCAGFPLAFDRGRILEDPSCIDRSPTSLDPERLDRWFLLRWPVVAWTLLRANRRQHRLMRDAAARFDGEFVPMLRQRVADERQVDRPSLSTPELVALFERRRNWVFNAIAPESLLPGVLGAIAWNRLERKLKTILGPTDAALLAGRVLGSIDAPPIRKQRELLARLASGAAKLDEVVGDMGHRGPGEFELSSPRWREQPERFQRLASQSQRASDLGQDEVDLTDALTAACRETGAASLAPDANWLLRQACELLPYRETGKDEFLRAYEVLRNVLEELARRWNIGAGIYFLTAAEIRHPPPPAELRTLIAERRATRQMMLRWEVPPVLQLPNDFEFLEPQESTISESVQGIPLSGGQAIGRVYQLPESGAADVSVCGRVVVAETIDAGSMPFLVDAAAIIVERGGALSHVALLARQLRIPAVAAQGIRSHVSGGELLQVDGDRGTVEFRGPAT